MTVIEVRGTPAPKGSNRAIRRGGHAVFVPGGSDTGRKRMDSWARVVRAAALDACLTTLDTPVAVEIIFRISRPKGHYGKRGLLASAPAEPSVKPDIDKLARCTLDALSGVAFSDDARITMLLLLKEYADPGNEGARIVVLEKSR